MTEIDALTARITHLRSALPTRMTPSRRWTVRSPNKEADDDLTRQIWPPQRPARPG